MSLAEAVRSAIRDRLHEQLGDGVFRPEHPAYTIEFENNLVSGVHREQFWADLSGGDGDELEGDPPKFCAAHSSSALAVNAFSPFRHRPAALRLAGITGFTEAQFEKKLATGLGGKSPNLDFFAAGPNGVVAVESKFRAPDLWRITN